MLKRVFGVRRRAGVPHDEVVAAWREEHIPNVVRDLQPDRYAVSFFRQRDDTAFDGMAVLAWDDEERGRAISRPAQPLQRCYDDALTERVGPAVVFEATLEHVAADGPRGPFKSVFWVTKRPGVAMGDLVRHWVDVHAPNVAGAAAGLGGFRYVISVGEGLPDDAPYHGIAEFHYEGVEAWKAHGRALQPDGFEELTDIKPGVRLIGEEVLVRG
jgi:hypothetical protein